MTPSVMEAFRAQLRGELIEPDHPRYDAVNQNIQP